MNAVNEDILWGEFMISIKNQSDTVIIVIHEIYGLNQHMENYCEEIGKQGFDVLCPNIIEREAFYYCEGVAAYQHFNTTIGFSKAFNKIKQLLSSVQNKYEKIIVIGFSIGATVAWLCSELSEVDGVIGYYGSRIRDYVQVNPQCPVLLFFPEEEPSFSVDELISKLSKKSIDIHKFKGKHGFCDPYSPNYLEESAQKAMKELESFFQYKIKVDNR